MFLDLRVQALVGLGRGSEDETLALAQRNARIKESALGPDHLESAWSQTLLGWVYRERGELEPAIAAQRVSVDRMASVLGEDHPDYAKALNSLASTLQDAGRLQEAKEFQLEVVRILDAADVTDVTRFTAWNNLAIMHEMLGEYDEARRLHEQTLRGRERLLPPDHPDLAQSHQNLAVVEALTGNLNGALDHFTRGLEIARAAFGETHPEVASALNNLAIVYVDLGDYLRARAMLEESLAIRERLFGREHWETAQTRLNLGSLLEDMGDREEAGECYREALGIYRKQLGERNPRVAITLLALGRILADDDQLRPAAVLFGQAADIWKESVGTEHADYASALENIGNVERRSGHLDTAERSLREALDVYARALPAVHPSVANASSELAVVLRERGDAAGALAASNRALAMRREIFGADHPSLPRELSRRAGILRDLGRNDEAFADALEAERISRANTAVLVRGVSERRALAWLARSERGLPVLVRLAADDPSNEARTRDAWDALIRARATVLEEMATRRRTATRLASRPEVHDLVETLSTARRRYANLVLRGPDEDVADWNARVQDARRAKEEAERRLGERTSEDRDVDGSRTAGLSDVLARLPEHAALVAYARWSDGTSDGYAAFVAREGASPRVLPLGDADEIDAAVADWHAALNTASGRGIRRIQDAAAQSASSIRALGEPVRERVWDPVAPLVRDAELVFVVPDGALHFVDLDALPAAATDQWLAEDAPLFHTLSAERDLAKTRRAASPGRGLLAIGAPDYDDPAADLGTDTRRGTHLKCDAVRSLHFLALPGTERESEDVAAEWKRSAGDDVVRFTGTRASEEAVKARAPGRRGLHLATHGFLIEEGCGSPLLHAGLALAGANLPEPPEDSEEDGILTAEEIASLPLEGVEWAVLSACETGLGGVRAGEGILGLRRAFETAGVGTLVTSLWAVDDDTTARWMKALYQARFGEGLSTPRAIRTANLRLLEERRAAGDPASPASWCGFVASGEWK
ncbi:MAG: CHAT domain-containing tetratricopeptide repeat protein [bacterium]